jgi:hypothetical protein
MAGSPDVKDEPRRLSLAKPRSVIRSLQNDPVAMAVATDSH